MSDIPFMYSGESKNLVITIANSGDLTGANFTWKLNVRNNPVIKESVKGEITVTDSANGVVQVSLHPNDTNTLSGIFTHELQMTDAQGNVSVVLLDNLQIKSNLI